MPQVPDPQDHVLPDVRGPGLTQTDREGLENREATSESTVARLLALTVDPAQGHAQGRTREVAAVVGLVKEDTTGIGNSDPIITTVELIISRDSKATTIKTTGEDKTSKTGIGSTIISKTIDTTTVEAASNTDTIITTIRIIVDVVRIEVVGSSTIIGKEDSAILEITGGNSGTDVPTQETDTAIGVFHPTR